ncbi:hypothetical protein ONR75_10950 [Rhodopseudomonas sp. P2A-2r]|uniref:hypothetical protein n=1 Tax=Rhodopseudomonas sp. P2A-2r TaxID=2991972 RepID=UPI002233FAAE|nr:hypothetical protein [Rhodopseudomonas sp. P2A-2r]UZE51081.1 hypothetical protein ONR75_10950 [Rhodopseudomonas sp. P2A-2r]
MRPLKLKIALVAIAVVAVEATHLVKAAEPKVPVAYFLGQSSDPAHVPNNLPGDATDVVVAKVRVLGRASWMGGRHGEGITNDILFTRVKIIEVKEGTAEVGQVLGVRMGLRNDFREFSYPHTPDQLAQEYAVLIYSSGDGLRRLAAFPISSSQYVDWQTEVQAYERQRGKPGYRE